MLTFAYAIFFFLSALVIIAKTYDAIESAFIARRVRRDQINARLRKLILSR